MWTPYQRPEEVEEREEAVHPETAPAMVRTWRRMRKKPQREGTRRRERVRKMQLEAAPKRM